MSVEYEPIRFSMESDRAVVVFAVGAPTTHGLFKRPDTAFFSEPLYLFDDGGIGSDRWIVEARLAAY